MKDNHEPLRRNPIPPALFDVDGWYQVKEFTTTRQHFGYLRLSRSAFLKDVKDGALPEGRKIGHQRYWYGRQLEAIKKGQDWHEISEPAKVIL